MSFTQFTLEDVNTMTVGTTNNLAVGEVNSAFCTGQTALTATTNNSVTLGTYLAAVLGNNVTWTYGTTLGMQDGATVDFSDSTSTQAQGTVALKGGIHPLGMSALAILKAAMTATKALIGVTVAINLVYGTALGVLDATDVSKDKVKQQAAEAASIGVSNALLTALLVVVVKRLSTLCEALRQTSTLTLGQTGVSLGTDFLPASQSTLGMSLAETTLTRITPRPEFHLIDECHCGVQARRHRHRLAEFQRRRFVARLHRTSRRIFVADGPGPGNPARRRQQRARYARYVDGAGRRERSEHDTRRFSRRVVGLHTQHGSGSVRRVRARRHDANQPRGDRGRFRIHQARLGDERS
ncbi:hypothetical protein [Caballeronia sp. LZ001]|uniref:hypothetical protein n=1 Tax=Caballeronia sp. LZ001 TaxID=3038553 RepID=UPI00285A7BD4|nr:hypothetical protein [Caballeronia sp. LZ001]MDR5805579.1 hypothetical protein [Caballeronia sp. LZ001]